MLRRLALLVAVVPLFAAAPAPAPATPAEVMDDLSASLTFDHALTLQDAGSEPRAVLRYRPRPGATATYEIVSRTAMDMSMTGPDGRTMSMPVGAAIPAVVMTMRNSVRQPLPNGLVPVEMQQLGVRFDGAVPPEMAEGMRGGLAGLQGMTFRTLIDAEGQPIQMDVVGGVDPAMADFVQQIADQTADRMLIFPTEPIGQGARWTSNLDMSMSGMDLSMVQSVVVRKVTPEAVDLDVALAMSVGDGGLSLPGMPPGVKPEITKFSGSGSGTTHVDLATLVSTGTMSMDMDVAMKMAVPGQPPIAMTMKVKQSTDMRPAAGR